MTKKMKDLQVNYMTYIFIHSEPCNGHKLNQQNVLKPFKCFTWDQAFNTNQRPTA